MLLFQAQKWAVKVKSDPLQQWLVTFDQLERKATRFGVTFKGDAAIVDGMMLNLKTKLGDAISAKSALACLANKMFVYLYLLQSTDRTNETVKSKMASMEKRHNESAGTNLQFFPIEVVALDDADIAAQAATSEVVRKHLPWLANIRVMKPYLLSEEVEGALTKYGQFGSGTWGEFAREAEADLRFPWKGGELPLTDMLHVFSESKDAEERAAALVVLNSGLGGSFSKLIAQTLAMIVGEVIVLVAALAAALF